MSGHKIIEGLKDAIAGRGTFDTVEGKFETRDLDKAIEIVNGWLPQPVTAKSALILRDRIAVALYAARHVK